MSVEGKWNVTMETPVGTMKFTWDLSKQHDAWRGRMIGQGMVKNSELRDIKVEGDAISFATTTQSPMGPLELSFKGAAAENEMPGVCSSRFGDFSFSAVRA